MDAFEYAFEKTIAAEKGYSDVSGDRGGRTKYGVTEAVFLDALRRGIIWGTSDIKDLTVAQTRAIFKTGFWLPLRLHEVQSCVVAAEIFDTGINMGIHMAAVITQTALNYLGEKIEVDGIIGTQETLPAINKWVKKDEQVLFVCLNGFQFVVYADLVNDGLIDRIQNMVRSDKDQVKFAAGWTKRIQSYVMLREG
ncbi:MAG: glycosyl hydrolase 108 family protein [Dehalococcoidia bacterium]|nr:glycosyl hydrolase 108 family protein [Dehalococcoidia bacterium]